MWIVKDHPKVYSNDNFFRSNSTRKLINRKIDKELSFNAARHTFAMTVTLATSVPIERVSKLLGHTKLSTSQIYARVLENKLSSDISKLDQIIGEKRKINGN